MFFDSSRLLGSLSHRPTLITKSIVFRRIWNLYHKNASPRVGLKSTTFVTLFFCPLRYPLAPRWIWGLAKNCLGFIGLQLNYRPCFIVCVGFGWLVGPSPSDISWQPFGHPICYNEINPQHGNCIVLAVWLRPSTNNKQHTTKYIQLAKRLLVRVQVQSFFYLSV